MTVPGNLSSPLLATAADSAAAGFKINRSLRFNSADSAYLNRTPSSAGNRKTYTLSFWVKKSKIDDEMFIFAAKHSGGRDGFRFEPGNTFRVFFDSANGGDLVTSQVFRDPSAWYHFVIAVDTTQSTAANRVKIYVNGTQIEDFSTETYPVQDYTGEVNNNNVHRIGADTTNLSNTLEGYLTEIHFVDGQALAPTDFGGFDVNNVWQPKEYSGTYGTNGFRLDFSDNSSNSALGTDSSGNSNTFTVNNLSAAYNFGLTNAAQIVGTSKYFEFPITYATTVTYEYFIKITTDGTYNYGAKEQTTNEWNIGHSGNSVLFGDFNGGFTTFSSTGLNDGAWHFVRLTTTGSSTSFYVDGSLIATNSSGGNVSTGSEVTNRIEGTGSGAFHMAHLRITTGGTPPTTGVPDISTMNAAAGSGGTLAFYDKLDDIASSGTKTSDGGNVTITMNAATVGVTDPNADSLIDTPTNYTASSNNNGGCYCTMNPLRSRLTLSNGNLDSTSPSDWKGAAGTIGMSSGKFYWEIDNVVSNEHVVGIVKYNTANVTWNTTYGYGAETGVKYLATGGVSYGAAWTTGDVIGVAFDADNGILEFYKNGTSQGVAATGLTDGPYLPSVVHNGSSRSASINFGQRPWHHSPKADHVALCTTNLSDPTIADGSTAFDVDTWSGDNSDPRSRTLSFGPDLVWIKTRNQTNWHYLTDSVRGAPNKLYANSTNAEDTAPIYGQIDSLNSDGFTLGGGTDSSNPLSDSNQSGTSYVAFAWNAGANSSKTYTVTVVSDSGNKYRFDGHGTSAVTLDLEEGSTYVFDQSDSSNSGHPLRFSSTSDGTHNSGSEYTTGVTSTGTPGSAGAKTTIVVASGAPTLYYYCSSHSGMGGQVNTNSTAGATVLSGSIRAASTVSSGNAYSAGWAGLNTGTWASSDSWSGLSAVSNNAKGYFSGTENLSDGSVISVANGSFSAGSSGSNGWVLRASATVSIDFTVYPNITEIATTSSDSQTFADRTVVATNPSSGSSVVATGKCFWFSNASSMSVSCLGTVNDAPQLPSITTTVRANQTAGFSIATYTGNGSANQTLGHGLGNAPAFVIIKDRTSSQNWAVLHTSAGTLGTLDGGTNYKLLELSSTAAARDASYNTIWHPTNTTVKIGEGASSAHWTNKSGDNYVMYAWAPVEGFSSFGSYEGTASSAFTDPFIWTGFRPRWIIIKNIDNYGTGYDWFIFDTARDTFNVAENQLKANLNAAEVDSDSIDILSNGFSIKTTENGLNLNSHTHVWAAFAEHPFKTARAA